MNQFFALKTDRQRGPLPLDSIQFSSLKELPTDVHKVPRRTHLRKDVGPDNIHRRALGVYSSELVDVFTDIFNLSLAQATITICFKCTTVVPLQKKSNVTGLKDNRPTALTPIGMKVFEWIVMTSSPTLWIPCSLHTFRTGPPTIHTALTHLGHKDT